MKPSLPLSSLLKKPVSEISLLKEPLSLVLNSGCGYLCGMCGSYYHSAEDAWQCVAQNLKSFRAFPVVAHSLHAHFYHCLLCSKKYMSLEDTANCLKNDLHKTHLPLAISQYLNALLKPIISLDNSLKIQAKKAFPSSPQPSKRTEVSSLRAQKSPSPSKVHLGGNEPLGSVISNESLHTTKSYSKIPPQKPDKLIVDYESNSDVMPDLGSIQSEIFEPPSPAVGLLATPAKKTA